MRIRTTIFTMLLVTSSLIAGTSSSRAVAADVATATTTNTLLVDGAPVHFLKAGQGPAVILLHGYTQTSHMWRGLIAQLARDFTVVAPDLPGIGDSKSLPGAIDMTRAARHIHSLSRALGIESASVVGHDIGLMVAYAYAAEYPSETHKLVVLDAFLPGVAGWRDAFDSPDYWHFRFHGATPEALVKGRERLYYDYYWNEFAADKTRSIPAGDRKIYTAAYARPGHMHAGWAYFESFPETAKNFAAYATKKLPMPVLSVGGKQAFGEFLGKQMSVVALNVKIVIVENSGHWLMEEQTKQTTDAIIGFLRDSQS